MRFRDLPRSCRAYVGVVCALALLVVAWAVASTPTTGSLELTALITLTAIVAHSFPVSTPGKQAYHVSLPFFVAAVVLLPPTHVLLTIGAVHIAEYCRRRRSGFAQVFNAAAYGLAAIAAHASFRAFWPESLSALDLAQPLCLVAGVSAALVFTGANRALVSIAIWLGNGISPREQHMFAFESLLTDGVLLLMGLPLAHLVVIAPWAAAAGAAPLWLIHRVLDLPNVRAQRRQDGLTELFSAPYLTETCTRELHRAHRFKRSTALVLLDLDGLGEVNAAYGPQAGDAVIRGTAVVIRKATREYDLAARLAGGMYAVLLPETDLAQAQVVAERVRRSVADRRYEVPGSVEQARVTVSVGAVVAAGPALLAEQLFEAAEVALAQAKRIGGNRSEFCELSGVAEIAVEEQVNEPSAGEDMAGTEHANALPPRPATQSQTVSRKRLLEVGLVVSAAGAGAWALLSGQSAPDWTLLGLLLAVLVLLDRRGGETGGRNGLALSLAAMAAGGMLVGPMGALLLAMALGVVRAATRRGQLRRVALETAMAVLVTTAAAAAFSTLGVVAFVLPPLAMRYLSRRYVDRAVDSVRKLRTLNEQLEHRAFHDPLTDLANRALFSERLEHAIRRAEDGSIAVLFLDLDNFKTVNDTHGHAAGDALLTIATQRLRQCVRWEDTIARLGGDEFTVLLENVRDVSQVARSAERIAEALRQPFVLDGQEVQVSASIGIALDTDRSHSSDDLLREADLAMYRAKAAGKSRYEIFDPSMGSDVMERLELESDLRSAIEADQLELFFEPLAGQMTARARWHHPRRGVFEAASLTTLAEESGLAAELGRWTLREACRQAVARHLTGPLSIAVSLSDPDLVADVEQALHDTALSPDRLELRIGGSDRSASIATLAALSGLGVALTFGDAARAERWAAAA